MHNPLRSEADAFRWVVVILAGAISVVILTLLTRPAVGLIWAAALIGFGLGVAYHNARGTLPSVFVRERAGDGRHRVLVVANETVGGEELLTEIGAHAGGRDSRVLVITPALTVSRAALWASDTDEAREMARQRLELSLLEIQHRLGISARGDVGDSDPIVAIEDALGAFPADEVVISTHPPESSAWLERDVVSRAREKFDLPISHVVVHGAEAPAPR